MIEDNEIWEGTKNLTCCETKEVELLWRFSWKPATYITNEIELNTVTNLDCEDTRELAVVLDHVFYCICRLC